VARKRLGIRILMGVGIVVAAFIVYALFLKNRNASASNTQGTQGTTPGANIQYVPVTGDSFTTESINQQGSNNTNSTVGGDTTTTGNTTTTNQNDTTPPPAPPPKHLIYTVKAGDTLASIAKDHGISLAALESAPGNWTTIIKNGSGSWDKIWVGQHLYIPQ
jgi:LysM repeat protein